MSDSDSVARPKRVFDFLRGPYMFKIFAAVLVVGIILAGIGYFTFVGVQASVQDDAEGILVSSAEREAVGIEGFLTDGNDNAVRIFGLNILVDGTDR